MFSLKIIEGDLTFENNDLALVSDHEELAQCAEVLLGTNKGEWFLDPDMGLDYQALLGKVVADEVAAEAIRTALLPEDRIQVVDSITLQRFGRQLEAAVVITGEDQRVEVKVSVD